MKEQKKAIVQPVKFLVCVDKSEHSRTALDFACAQAAKRGGLIDMLHVLEPADFKGLASIADKMREERREAAEKLLKELAEHIQEKYGITPSMIFREGKITEEILSAVEEDVDANMLVMGAAPDTKSKRGDLIGWLAAQLGDKLLIPMLLVPGNLTEQQIEKLS